MEWLWNKWYLQCGLHTRPCTLIAGLVRLTGGPFSWWYVFSSTGEHGSVFSRIQGVILGCTGVHESACILLDSRSQFGFYWSPRVSLDFIGFTESVRIVSESTSQSVFRQIQGVSMDCVGVHESAWIMPDSRSQFGLYRSSRVSMYFAGFTESVWIVLESTSQPVFRQIQGVSMDSNGWLYSTPERRQLPMYVIMTTVQCHIIIVSALMKW